MFSAITRVEAILKHWNKKSSCIQLRVYIFLNGLGDMHDIHLVLSIWQGYLRIVCQRKNAPLDKPLKRRWGKQIIRYSHEFNNSLFLAESKMTFLNFSLFSDRPRSASYTYFVADCVLLRVDRLFCYLVQGCGSDMNSCFSQSECKKLRAIIHHTTRTPKVTAPGISKRSHL